MDYYRCIRDLRMDDTNELEFTRGHLYLFQRASRDYLARNNSGGPHYLGPEDMMKHFIKETLGF